MPPRYYYEFIHWTSVSAVSVVRYATPIQLGLGRYIGHIAFDEIPLDQYYRGLRIRVSQRRTLSQHRLAEFDTLRLQPFNRLPIP